MNVEPIKVHLSPSNFGNFAFNETFNSFNLPSLSNFLSQIMSTIVAFLSVYDFINLLSKLSSSSSLPIFSNIFSILFASE